jgi:hypothetical protein
MQGSQLEFVVGFKLHGKPRHVIVDAEDALAAALKVRIERPEALITYVRRRNKRGDARHPVYGPDHGTSSSEDSPDIQPMVLSPERR